MKRTLTLLIIVFILLIAAVAAYVYYLMYVPPQATTHITDTTGQGGTNGFNPLNTNNGNVAGSNGSNNGSNGSNGNSNSNNSSSATATSSVAVPVLRELSQTPVGGYGVGHNDKDKVAIVRWIDRGRGNIYEATDKSPDTVTLSNTLVPRVYVSWWNHDLTSFVAQYISDSSDKVTTILASIQKSTPATAVSKATSGAANKAQAASSASSTNTSATNSTNVTETPFMLKGKLISSKVIASTYSPTRDKILLVSNEGDHAVGYISKFDGTGQAQVFDVPMTQITVDWPETNTITITTKASALYSGYFYAVNVRTGEMKAVLANIPGLKARMNADATKVFYSQSDDNIHIKTTVLDLKTGQTTDVIFRTLADKCAWGSKNKQVIYCGVPSQLYDGTYPDDWYLGGMTFSDKIWSLDAATNKAQLISSPLSSANASIDAENLQIDPNDEYLYFMNKKDLSLWSLDLASTN